VSDSNVIKLTQPGAFSDSLTEILRSGARALLTQAIEAEVAEFLAKHADLKTATGQQRVVRHGHLPERAIMTGIGPVAVRQPRVRDREATEGERIRYSPSILPRIRTPGPSFAKLAKFAASRDLSASRTTARPCCHSPAVASLPICRRRHEAANLSREQAGEFDRRRVLILRADDLQAHR
jgi:hypothetical protein